MIRARVAVGKSIKNAVENKKEIKNKKELLSVVKYVAIETSKLAQKIVGKKFPIKSLTIFSHSQREYETLVKMLEDLGRSYNENNGPRVELYNPIAVENNHITHLRIRRPDSERPQVGCNDFETDYETFKKEYLLKYSSNLRLIKRPEYEMIEFFDPEFDVLAYVVSN